MKKFKKEEMKAFIKDTAKKFRKEEMEAFIKNAAKKPIQQKNISSVGVSWSPFIRLG